MLLFLVLHSAFGSYTFATGYYNLALGYMMHATVVILGLLQVLNVVVYKGHWVRQPPSVSDWSQSRSMQPKLL